MPKNYYFFNLKIIFKNKFEKIKPNRTELFKKKKLWIHFHNFSTVVLLLEINSTAVCFNLKFQLKA